MHNARTSVRDVGPSAKVNQRAATVERDGFTLRDLVQHVSLEVRVGEQFISELARHLQPLERLSSLDNLLDVARKFIKVRLRHRESVLQEHLVEEAALTQGRAVRKTDLVLEFLLQSLHNSKNTETINPTVQEHQ